MSYSLDTIDAAKLATAKAKVLDDIKEDRRRSAAMRAIAKHFAGAYCTRRLLPQLAALFPDAKHVYIGEPDYGRRIYLYLCYGFQNDDCIYLCTSDDRHIDGARLNADADSAAARAERSEAHLQRLDETVSAYNAIAADYAEIYSQMREWFSEIPYADYNLTRQAEARREKSDAITLRTFARKYA